jgi:hypothetical protein
MRQLVAEEAFGLCHVPGIPGNAHGRSSRINNSYP